jgi:DNA-binding Xre family transcriptional regulator
VKNFDAELLEALCDVLAVEPGELLERDKGQKRRRPIVKRKHERR